MMHLLSPRRISSVPGTAPQARGRAQIACLTINHETCRLAPVRGTLR